MTKKSLKKIVFNIEPKLYSDILAESKAVGESLSTIARICLKTGWGVYPKKINKE